MKFYLCEETGSDMIDKVMKHFLSARSFIQGEQVKTDRKETNNVTYKEARVYLDEVSKYGSVLGLDTIRDLLCELGNPQDALKFIHIAGTNGKGSVLAYTSTILSEAGLKTGRYVSPTVQSYLERIQVDGQWISEEVFAELVEEVQKAVARMEADGKASPTVFEIETAIAFLYFRKLKCDVVVLETGLGGALDATNIVKNTVIAVFTTISRDHMGFLGNTLSEIAGEKAGIIKPGSVVVSAPQVSEVRAVLEEKAAELGCRIVYAEERQIRKLKENYREQVFSYKELQEVKIHLSGRYQLLNAVTAYEVLDAWNQSCHNCPQQKISGSEIRRGFEKTIWPGRFTCISENPIFIIDGAHNEDASKRLRESVEAYFPGKKLTYIMGVFQDKEYEKIVENMLPYAKRIYTVTLPDEVRSLDAQSLADTIIKCEEKRRKSLGNETEQRIEVSAVGEIGEAVHQAMAQAEKDEVILAFGSLSYLGKVIQMVNEWK